MEKYRHSSLKNDILSTGFTSTGKELMRSGKIVKNHVSTGALYGSTLRIHSGMTYFRKKRADFNQLRRAQSLLGKQHADSKQNNKIMDRSTLLRTRSIFAHPEGFLILMLVGWD